MTDKKQEFISAIENDECCEWEISEDLVLVTVWEGDGYFNPYVLDLECQYSEDEVMTILDNTTNDVFNFEVLWFEDSNNESYNIYYPEGLDCEYENYERWE